MTLCVIVAAGVAAMTFPSSCIEARVGVSIMVAATAIISAASAVMMLSSLSIDLEVAVAVVSAAAASVAFAAAWAVGVMVSCGPHSLVSDRLTNVTLTRYRTWREVRR